jgi:hypothetical protein
VDPVVYVMVERQPVGAADEAYTVPAQQLEKLVLAALEAPLGVRLVMAAEVRRHVGQHDTMWCVGRLQAALEELECLLARSLDRHIGRDVHLTRLAGRTVDRHEVRMASCE